MSASRRGLPHRVTGPCCLDVRGGIHGVWVSRARGRSPCSQNENPCTQSRVGLGVSCSRVSISAQECTVLLTSTTAWCSTASMTSSTSGSLSLLGTGSVCRQARQLLARDYGPQHGYVMELCIVLMDCDDFFLRRYDCFDMDVFLVNCDSSRITWFRSTHQKQIIDFFLRTPMPESSSASRWQRRLRWFQSRPTDIIRRSTDRRSV